MHQHGASTEHNVPEDGEKIILVGNPNVGKSAIFGLLTGRYVTVSNYPGTTVEVTSGEATLQGKRSHVVDTPGVNSLIPMSEDEMVTRDILLTDKYRAVVQVADAKNLRRALLIGVQLAEMGVPFVLDLNMSDEARGRGITIDVDRLAEILGVDVVSTVATQRHGMGRLVNSILNGLHSSGLRVPYDEPIEDALEKLDRILPETNISRRSIALMLLAGDNSLADWLQQHVSEGQREAIIQISREAQSKYTKPLNYVISEQRMDCVNGIMEQVYSQREEQRRSFATLLGKLSMHPVWGWPILLVVLYLTYKIVGEFGAGTCVDFMENIVFGRFINPWSEAAVNYLIPVAFLRELLVGQYGMITMALSYAVAIVLPIVGFFFIVFGIMEDTGYLPRLAVMVNRAFRVMGLNGKAVLPMVLGLGCDTMATLTARILESKKERLIVILLLALGVPCSAQLGVILGMLGGLSSAAMIIWIATVILVMLLVGFLASLIIPGRSSDFVLELPPIRRPQISNILIKTLARIEWYLKEAVPLFMLGTLVLFILDKFKLLSMVERWASPVVGGLLGLPQETTAAFLIGFLRRDYGAAGLYDLASAGALDNVQILVSLVTLTLFVPCIANFFIIVKERGLKVAIAIVSFIFPFAFAVGGVLNLILRSLEVSL